MREVKDLNDLAQAKHHYTSGKRDKLSDYMELDKEGNNGRYCPNCHSKLEKTTSPLWTCFGCSNVWDFNETIGKSEMENIRNEIKGISNKVDWGEE